MDPLATHDALARGGGRDQRALSPLVAVVLLMGIVIAVALVIVVVGLGVLDDARDQAAAERASQTMQQVRSDFDSLPYADGPVSLPGEEFEDGRVWTEQRGTLVFQLNPDRLSAGECTASLPLGTFLYESGGDTYAYQAGGVWSRSDSGSVALATPDLTHERAQLDDVTIWTMRFPVTTVEAVDTSSGRPTAVYDHDRSADRRQQLRADLCLPPDDHDEVTHLESIRIEVRDNPYHEAWARFLERELGGDSRVWTENETVIAVAPLGPEITRLAPERFDAPPVTVLGVLHSTSTDELHLQNRVVVDSYNSTDDSYADTVASRRHSGQVVTAGGLRLSGHATVDGNAYAGGAVTVTSAMADVTGESVPDSTVQEPFDPTDFVDAYVDAARAGHGDGATANAGSDAVDDTALESGDRRLDAGVYYFDSLVVDDGDELTLDTTGGDVVIAVENDVRIGRGATVDVDGPNDVRWFVRDTIAVDREASVSVAGDRSTGNWLFGTSETTTSIGRSSTFVGVVYTPGGAIDVRGGPVHSPTNVYGALVGDVEVTGWPHTALHYDRAIEAVSVVGDGVQIGDGQIVGPGDVRSFDARVTLMGAEYATVWRNYYLQAPIAASLVFEYENGTVDRHEPWPGFDLDAVSSPSAGWDDDVNHPAVTYPLTYDVEAVPANTSFTVELEYRTDFCADPSSDAGTTRRHDGRTYFERGCASPDPPQERINVIEHADSERIKVLRDGDRVPDIDASEAQRTMQDMLGPKLDTSGPNPVLDLEPNEFAVVFELSTQVADPTWAQAIRSGAGPPDYNDVVLLYEITDVEYEDGDDVAWVDPAARPDGGYEYAAFTIAIDGGVIRVDLD